MADHYTYRVSWSAEDEEFVATCAEFPSLSWLDENRLQAFEGIQQLVRDILADMEETGETAPEPLAEKQYSGKLLVRVPPNLHRRLALEAAEAKISLNRHVTHKLETLADG